MKKETRKEIDNIKDYLLVDSARIGALSLRVETLEKAVGCAKTVPMWAMRAESDLALCAVILTPEQVKTLRNLRNTMREAPVNTNIYTLNEFACLMNQKVLEVLDSILENVRLSEGEA